VILGDAAIGHRRVFAYINVERIHLPFGQAHRVTGLLSGRLDSWSAVCLARFLNGGGHHTRHGPDIGFPGSIWSCFCGTSTACVDADCGWGTVEWIHKGIDTGWREPRVPCAYVLLIDAEVGWGAIERIRKVLEARWREPVDPSACALLTRRFGRLGLGI
jgi:hypothetical protein